MTRDEILALSDVRLRAAAFAVGYLHGAKEHVFVNDDGYVILENKKVLTPDYPHSIAAAWELFNAVYDKKSPLYGGTWVLGTVDDGKDCAQATLFLHLPWRARWKKAWKSGKIDKVDKYQATEKSGRMARAITLVYVMAMEDARGNK